MPYGPTHEQIEFDEYKKTHIDMVAIVIILLSVALTYTYATNIIYPNEAQRLVLHDQIIRREAPDPYNDRILVPVTMQLMMSGLGRDRFSDIYTAYCLIAIMFSMTLMYRLWRIWFSQNIATIGLLAYSLSYYASMHYHYFQPWSHLEPGLIAMSLLAVNKKRTWLIFVSIALIIANRYCGISPTRPISEYFALGIADWKSAVIAHVAFWHITLLYALLGFRSAPRWLKYAGIYMIPMLLAFILFSRWRETRPLLSLMPVMIPYALSEIRSICGG